MASFAPQAGEHPEWQWKHHFEIPMAKVVPLRAAICDDFHRWFEGDSVDPAWAQVRRPADYPGDAGSLVRAISELRVALAAAMVRAEAGERRAEEAEAVVGRTLMVATQTADEVVAEAKANAAAIEAAAKNNVAHLLETARASIEQSFEQARRQQAASAAEALASQARYNDELLAARQRAEASEHRLAELIVSVAGQVEAQTETIDLRTASPAGLARPVVPPLRAEDRVSVGSAIAAPLHLDPSAQPSWRDGRVPQDQPEVPDGFADLRDALENPQPLGPRDDVIEGPWLMPTADTANGEVRARRRGAHSSQAPKRNRVALVVRFLGSVSVLVILAEVVTTFRPR